MGRENARVVQNDVVKRLLKERKIDHKTIRAMNAIAKKLGIDIIFADDVETGDVESDKYADQIMRHIGEQIPANWLDKWNAWRMLSMLGNAKTHIRNFGSNLAC